MSFFLLLSPSDLNRCVSGLGGNLGFFRDILGAKSFLVPALLTALSLQVPSFSPSKQTCFREAFDASYLSCYSHSLDTLVVGGPRDFNVSVTLRNDGEDSYGTKVTIYYPPGLSFRKVSASQVAKSSAAP